MYTYTLNIIIHLIVLFNIKFSFFFLKKTLCKIFIFIGKKYIKQYMNE